MSRNRLVIFATVLVFMSGANQGSIVYATYAAGVSGISGSKLLIDDNGLEGRLKNADLASITSDEANNDFAAYQQSSCKIVPVVHLLKHPGCQSRAIESFACLGSCPSYVKISPSKLWQHERSCSCCQQTGSREATFVLDCPSLDPPYRKVKAHAPADCLCRSCTDLGREDLRPQELVEALANEVSSVVGVGGGVAV